MGNGSSKGMVFSSVLDSEFDEMDSLPILSGGHERLCFVASPEASGGRGLSYVTSARRKARTMRDEDGEDVEALPDEEPEGWATP